MIELSEKNSEKSEIFNLGHYETMNVIKLADIVCQEMGLKNVEYSFKGGKRGWIGDSPLVHLDINKAQNLGWYPTIKIEESIRKTVRYLLSDNSRRYR